MLRPFWILQRRDCDELACAAPLAYVVRRLAAWRTSDGLLSQEGQFVVDTQQQL